jgi:heptaprenyl diphosphate synthase
VVDVMTRYGERIGVAFQLSDDILDIASDSGDSGKTPGTDLREGIATLPVLHLRRMQAAGQTGPADARLLELLERDLTDDALHAEALSLLRAHPAMQAARTELARWAAEARATLDVLPDVPARAGLDALCDVIVARVG